jgi:hypothetical protein
MYAYVGPNDDLIVSRYSVGRDKFKTELVGQVEFNGKKFGKKIKLS